MVVPNWLKKFISEKDVNSVEHKISEIENKSDVEIVPIVVQASSSYPQTRISLMLVLILIFSFSWESLGFSMHWGGMWLGIGYLLLALALIIIVPAWLSRFGIVQMWMTHRFAEEEQCFKRAQLEYYKEKIQSTQKQNGLLIFISMLERRVMVLSDKGIQDKMQDNSPWDEAVKRIINGIRKKNLAEGLISALDSMQVTLSENFPLENKEQNQLPNKLVIKN